MKFVPRQHVKPHVESMGKNFPIGLGGFSK